MTMHRPDIAAVCFANEARTQANLRRLPPPTPPNDESVIYMRRGRRTSFFFFFFFPPRGFAGYIPLTVMLEYICLLKVETTSPIASPPVAWHFVEINHLFAFFEFPSPSKRTGERSTVQGSSVPSRPVPGQQGSCLPEHLFETS